MMKIHITKQGESIDTIANKYTVSKQDLTGINPHVNLSSDLVPGLKLKIPDASRAEKNEHIEKFYPNLDHEKFLKEQAVPIGLKPFESPAHTQYGHTHHHTPHQHTHTEAIYPEHPTHSTPRPDASLGHGAPWGHETPWGHLGEHTTHLNLNPEIPHHHPWNQPFPPFSTSDTRAIFPPIPYYPPYYPYGYGYPYSYPYGYGLPFFGFGPGYGYGGFGFGHGFHGGGGHFGGHGHR